MTESSYALLQRISEILDLASLEGGEEFSPEILAAVQALEGDFKDKLDALCKLAGDYNRIETMYRAEAAEAAQLAEKYSRRREGMRDQAFALMHAMGETKVVTDRFRLNVQTSPPRTRLRDGVTTSDLPPDYVRITEAPNLSKILADYKLGTLPEDVSEKVVVESDNKFLKILPR